MSTHHTGQGDLKSLHSELHPVSDKWFSLGVQLQVPIETLKCIRRENLPMTEHLLEMLTVWLKCTNPPPTWNILTEALESPPVGERLLAQQLRDKYCPRTERGETHSCPTQGQFIHSAQALATAQGQSLSGAQALPTPQVQSFPGNQALPTLQAQSFLGVPTPQTQSSTIQQAQTIPGAVALPTISQGS